MQRTQLSPHFYLDEFTRSQTAARHGIVIDVLADQKNPIFVNLIHLCMVVLEPIRVALGPVTVTSGYRPHRVNALVGGSPTSDHVPARAADITVGGHVPLEVAEWVAASDIPFQQLILEYNRWVHISTPPQGEPPKREILTAYHTNGHTKYAPGIRPELVV